MLGVYDGPTAIVSRAHGRVDNLNVTNIWDNVSTSNTVNLWYHASNRLQNADGPWGARTYYYDGVGNRTHEIATVGASTTTDVYGYPGTSNRLTNVVRNGTTTSCLPAAAGRGRSPGVAAVAA